MKPADAEKLVDISSIQVDPSLPYEERIKSYLSQRQSLPIPGSRVYRYLLFCRGMLA